MDNRVLPEGSFVDEYGRLNLPSGATGIISGNNETTTTGLSNHPYTGEPGNWHYNLMTGWIDYSKLGPPAQTPYSFDAYSGRDDNNQSGQQSSSTSSYEQTNQNNGSTQNAPQVSNGDGSSNISVNTGMATVGQNLGSYTASPVESFSYATPQVPSIGAAPSVGSLPSVRDIDFVKVLRSYLTNSLFKDLI